MLEEAATRGGKLEYLRAVVGRLNEDVPDVLQRLITRLTRSFEDPEFDEGLSDLREALGFDGFEIDKSGSVVPNEILKEELHQTPNRLSELLESATLNDPVVLAHH